MHCFIWRLPYKEKLPLLSAVIERILILDYSNEQIRQFL